MRRLSVLALATLVFAGCAGWQTNTRKALRAISVGADEAVQVAEGHCQGVLEQCKAAKMNPCPPLGRCVALGMTLTRAAIGAQLAALSGYDAVEAAEQGKALEWLKKATALMDQVKRVLEAMK
jgi:tartrate dehydratase alpha subunit/fumarate hydratase class I-like protein